MRAILKWGFQATLVLALLALAAGIWKRDQIKQLLAVNSLFSGEKIVHNFSHMDELMTHVPVPRGSDSVVTLPMGPAAEMPETMADWITDRQVTGLVVMKDGAIVHEDYFLRTKPEDLRISW